MPKTLSARRFNLGRSRTKIATVSQEMKKSKKILSLFFVVMIIAMSLAYIFQMSSIATNGYEVKKYENQLASLKKENQKITVELADLKAMHNLENSNKNLVAVEHNDIFYITASGSSAVAMQK